MIGNTNLINHCKDEIKATENEISEIENIKKNFLNIPHNEKLFQKLTEHLEGKKEIYQTLLDELSKESQ